MQVIVDGLAINYERIGSGRSVVVLPGWSDTLNGWRDLVPQLASKYDVTVLDLPGFGGSESPKTAWGLNDFAKFLDHFLDKIGLKPFALVGHSNGGAIAVRSLTSGQISCEKLVLLASAGIRGEAKGRNQALKVVAKTGKLLTKPLSARTQERLRRKLYGAAGSDLLVAEHMQETFKKIVADDIRSDAARLELPTLLIYGENDDQTPVRYGELLHELITNSTLEILPGAGHFVHQDRPADVLKSIQEFLK